MDFNNSKMKTSLLILISFLTITAHSQNNLFFDEVKLIRFSTQPSVTVPPGKVWKIVGADLERTNVSVNITINEDAFYLSGVNTGVNNQIWLPEGTIVKRGAESSSSGNLMPTSTISVIQYAVIPISSSTTGSTASTGGFTSTTDFVGSGQYTTTKDYTEADSFTDIDGNEYGAVNIDGAIWSTSNLRVTKFSDGTPIREATSWSDFNGAIEAMYYDANGDGSNVVYNWLAISGDHDFEYSTPRKNLAPEGYRVTSYFDWKRLLDKYGGINNASTFLLSKNFNRIPGLDKAGLNLMQTSHFVRTSGAQAYAFYGTNTYSYTSSSALLFWGLRFMDSSTAISYQADFESIVFNYSSNSYADAVVVRVVKNN